MIRDAAPDDYETKFAEFIRLCAEAKKNKVNAVLIAEPWVLGDTREEMIESLSRLADAGLALQIAKRSR